MYPPLFAEPRTEELHRLVRGYPLGILVAQTPHGLDANHLPFLLDPEPAPLGRLLAHVARANPLWQELRDGAEVLVIFRGAQGYISPNWYPSKAETHRHVPTWNYEAVHAHGTLNLRDDERFVRGVVARLTREHEAAQPSPWKMGDAPADYLAEQLRQIVGIEVTLTRWEGKRKLSQNREARDVDGVVRALEAQGQPALAQATKQANGR